MRLVLQIEAEVRERAFPEIINAMDTRLGVIVTIPTTTGGEITIEGALTGAKEPTGA